jgi:DNA-binding NarL/FixJ family response regulator
VTGSVLRVLVADDHPILLAGLTALIESDPGLELAGSAADGRTALALAMALRPDVVVLDISLPDLSGADVTRALLAGQPDCRILVLTVHEDRSTLRRMLELGVAGYLVKRSAADELTRAIQVVAAGGTYLDPAIAGKAFGGDPKPSVHGAAGPAADLSERETEVMRFVAAGHSNKEIAARLSISIKTIETYKARGMDKLGFKTRVDVVRYGVRQGWLSERT